MDDFLDAMHRMDYQYHIHRGDFLPEIEDPGMWGDWQINLEYWNGYYSSFPVYKTLVR